MTGQPVERQLDPDLVEASARGMSYAQEMRAALAMREGGDAETWLVCSMIQGVLAGQMMNPASEIHGLVNIADVEVDQDIAGNYQPYFTIVTASGKRICVSVNPEMPAAP